MSSLSGRLQYCTKPTNNTDNINVLHARRGIAVYFRYLCSPNGGKPDTGHQLATATSTLLVGGTLPRALKTKKFMPAGLIAAIGTISLVYNGKKAYEWENGV